MSEDDAPEEVVVPIGDMLDLHSFRPRDVLSVVDAYLDAAVERGYREVRVVHGRGIGMQREAVRKLLADDPRVAWVRDASHDRGGWGATIVGLRTSPRA